MTKDFENLGEPDLKLAGFELWIHSRQYSDAWRNVHVPCVPFMDQAHQGTLCGRHGAIDFVKEQDSSFGAFFDQLSDLGQWHDLVCIALTIWNECAGEVFRRMGRRVDGGQCRLK